MGPCLAGQALLSAAYVILAAGSAKMKLPRPNIKRPMQKAARLVRRTALNRALFLNRFVLER